MQGNAQLVSLFKSMRRIARAIDVQSRRIDREYGLTLPQLVVLDCVHRLGEVTSRAISSEADLSPATVVGILDNLELKGLIVRYRSGVDRRIVHTCLTGKGKALAEAAPFPLGAPFEEAFNRLEPQAQSSAAAAFHTIADLVDPPPAGMSQMTEISGMETPKA